MHFTTVVVGSLAALASTASAANVAVYNKCKFPIYVKATPNNNAGPDGPVVKLPKLTGSWSVPYQMPAGAAVKISKTADGFATPLTMEYTPSNNLVYYDISDNSGNPFAAYRNTLYPANKKCFRFDCDAGEPNCYSNGITPMVKTCPTTNLVTTICA